LAGAASGGAPSENETAGAGGTLTGTGGGSSSAGAAGSAGTGTATTRPAEGKPACGTGTVGGDPGDVVGNFKLQDQNGNTVWLSDFCDKTIFIEGAAMWCPYCRAMAKELGKLYPKYKDRGFTVLTLLIENNDFESAVPPTTAELKEWADTFDLETPVLADPKGKIFDKLWRSGGLPMAKLLTPGAKIKIEDPDVSEVERHFDP
jgi:peroxiredoxin